VRRLLRIIVGFKKRGVESFFRPPFSYLIRYNVVRKITKEPLMSVDVSEIQINLDRDELFGDAGLVRMKESYLKRDETSPQERYAFVSAKFGSNVEHAQRLYDYASKHWLSFSTPILAYGRSNKSLPISCFLPWLQDSAEGLVNTFSEVSWLSMSGGGVGIGIGIRGTDSKSTGVMAHLKTYDASSLAYRQGSTRRGSFATYLDISHPDILTFIEMRKPTGDPNMRTPNLHHGVNIPDSFMNIIEKCMVDDDVDDSWELIEPNSGEIREVVSARRLWENLIMTRMATGEPYLHFIDASNRGLPEFQKSEGLMVRQSNLCVAPETKILTKKGHVQISSLEGQKVDVWNGREWSNVEVYKTSESASLIKVTLSSGQILECTPEHKFYVHSGKFARSEVVKVAAKDLVVGNKLMKFELPIIEGSEDFPYAYENGFYSGDGCELENGKQRVYLYHEKQNLISLFYTEGKSWYVQEGQNRSYIDVTYLQKKFSVPTASHTIKSRLDWFAGLIDADGTSPKIGNSQGLQLASVNREFLIEIQLMLQTLGVRSTLNIGSEAGIRKMPLNDGSGLLGDFMCQAGYRLLIAQPGITTLQELGFVTHRVILTDHVGNRDAGRFTQVVSVVDEGRVDSTYCFTEPIRHMGVFNGILTGQCSEILLATDENRTAVCCLSSVNLEKWDDWHNEPLFLSDIAEMLDNVLTVFINEAPSHISRAIYSASQERSIGVGALGFHALLQSKRIPFESAQAKGLNLRVFKHIRQGLDVANDALASRRGPCPDAAKYGVNQRFAHVMAVAPNASTSILLGNTSPSIEPFKANAYRQDTLSGAFFNTNKFLKRVLEEYGHDTDEIWSSIMSHNGSVAHLDFMSDWDKKVFATAVEIDQMWVVAHAADRQEHIDQGQSLNLFFAPDAPINYIHAVHFSAWKKGLKTLYYARSEKLLKADKVGDVVVREKYQVDMSSIVSGDECLACEG
jgi:ribonucleoside-diphosphate reductase alpha chain